MYFNLVIHINYFVITYLFTTLQIDGYTDQQKRKKDVHNPKMAVELIEFLESSEVNLLDRVAVGKH